MTRNDVAANDLDTRGARLRIPRSRGALSGVLLLLLGAWGALAPLLGPYVHSGFTPDTAWHLSSGRFWLEILPGAVTALGGLLLLVGANRITTSFGGWLAVAGGAWFIVGPSLRVLLHLGTVGAPIHTSRLGAALETLLLFSGLGALILFLAATAVGRLAIIGVRDVQAAQRRAAEDAPPRRSSEDTGPTRVVRETPVVTSRESFDRAEPVDTGSDGPSRYQRTDSAQVNESQRPSQSPTDGGATRLGG